MKNRKLLTRIAMLLLVLGIGLGAYHLTIHYYPNLVYRKAIKKIGVADNTLTYRTLPDASFKKVVQPNPDFLYVLGTYNLKEGPIQLTGVLPDSTYWSLALYSPNTVNYYVKNDQQFLSNKLNVIIKEEEYYMDDAAAEIIDSPTPKGMILFRILVTDNNPKVVKQFQKYQESIKLQQL